VKETFVERIDLKDIDFIIGDLERKFIWPQCKGIINKNN